MNLQHRSLLYAVSTSIAFFASFGGSTVAQALGIPAPFTVARDPSPTSSSSSSSSSSSNGSSNGSGTTTTPVAATFVAAWNSANAQAPEWTAYAQEAIANHAPNLIAGSNDVATFCPKYASLATSDRINFWVQLIAAMSKYESGWNPADRYVETTEADDPVTGQPTVSEGLLQLSYSDGRNYQGIVAAGLCVFNYEADLAYAVTDLRRTILDPKTNLGCGIGILNRQVQRDGLIAESTNAYWSVIKTDRSTNKLTEIRAITNALPFCN